jgi:hypothetical protein
MTFVLKAVVAVSAGGIIALILNAGAPPTPAAIPILVAGLVFAGLALFAIGRRQSGDSGGDAPPEETGPPSDKEVVVDRPIEVTGTITSVTGPSRGVSRVLPGVGEKVKVTCANARWTKAV